MGPELSTKNTKSTATALPRPHPGWPTINHNYLNGLYDIYFIDFYDIGLAKHRMIVS